MGPWNDIVAEQYGAAIDMLENAIRACPDTLWAAPDRDPQFWYVAFHTLFWLDYYLSEGAHDFRPPEPFGLEEMDPAGVMPPYAYDKDVLIGYAEQSRARMRSKLGALTDEGAGRRCAVERVELTVGGLLLYDLRHVQHHAAQLNLLLRQAGCEPPRWVARSR